ncbi:MAG: hypothetical protein SGCHY_001150 [Lobulomycetales sp.]
MRGLRLAGLCVVGLAAAFSVEFEVNDIPAKGPTVSVGAKDSLRIRTRLGLEKPLLASLALTSIDTGTDASFILLAQKKFHNIVLAPKDISPGSYKLHVYTDTENFSIEETIVVAGSQPEAETVDGFEPSFSPLPEITHVFRKPEKMPYQWVSFIFAVAVLTPWVFLLRMWSLLDVNIGNLFALGSGMAMYGSAFMCSLVAFCLLYVAYFVKLKVFEMLSMAAGLGVVLFLLGRQTLVLRRAHFRKLQT